MDESNKENINENQNRNEIDNYDDDDNSEEILNAKTFLHQQQSSPKKSKGNNYNEGDLSLIQGNMSYKGKEIDVTMTDVNHSILLEDDCIINQRYSRSPEGLTSSSSSLLSSVPALPYTVSDANSKGILDPVALQYQLSAVVRHIGVTAFTGHYICDTPAPPSSTSPSSSSSSSSSSSLFASSFFSSTASTSTSDPTSGSPSILPSSAISAHTTVSSSQSEHDQNSNSDSSNANSVIWNRTNDSLVHRIPESTVLADMESPYIFFYTRI